MMKAMYLSAVVAVMLFATVSLYAQYAELYNFNFAKEGANPNAPALLAQGQDGNLYGTLQNQLSGGGSVFNWSVSSGALSEIFGFPSNGLNGRTPQSGLSLGTEGSFYGAAETGGANGFGTVFKVTPSGTLTVLYSFTNGADGAYPWAPPIQTSNGTIYGATYNGTTPGTAYKIRSDGTFFLIASLPSKTTAPFILGTDGNLYGTSQYGGTFNEGTVFRLTTAGVLTIIHSFGSSDGTIPTGPVMQAADGKLYGVTSSGGTFGLGIIYSMNTSGGSFKVLHNFQSSEGSSPGAGLVQGSDKYLYGVAQAGGASAKGTLFRVNTTGTAFSVLYNFTSASGDTPMSTPVIHTNGLIYGTTNHGGPVNVGYGTIYSYNAGLKPFASLVIIWSGKVGTKVGILGQGFTTATQVSFGSAAATYTVVSDNYVSATVPSGATTSTVTVSEPSGDLVTPQTFKVTPTMTSFSPTSGPVGTSVVLTGNSLQQTTSVTFNGVKATTFSVQSDTKVTVTVPTGATTGKIKVTTKGGTATSSTKFTVP